MLFTVVHRGRVRDNGIKVKKETFGLGIRKNLFPREDGEAVRQAAREVV